jgi:penicillin-binding protein 2
MVKGSGSSGQRQNSLGGVDRQTLRIAVLGVLVVAAFVTLFSRLWFLQILATDQYQALAKENRVRTVYSEPPRGRILDRNGKPLVVNKESIAVTIDRDTLQRLWLRHHVFKRLKRLLGVKLNDLRQNANSLGTSPYKAVPVAYDVSQQDASIILENRENYPGVGVETLPVRTYPGGALAAQDLGYVGQISKQDLRLPQFKGGHPPYAPGDIVGKLGVERVYDRYLRGTPGIEKVVVNSVGEPTQTRLVQRERPGPDLVLSLDEKIQRETQRALKSGIQAARGAGFAAPAGSAVVMDPRNGQILALASLPTYNPSIAANGLTTKEFDRLGAATPNNPDDDAFLNRPIQAAANPGSTFKVVTAGAAMATGVATPYSTRDCPGSMTIPPQGGPGSVLYHNWTPASFGLMGFPESLEVSCDTFYYELGYEMQTHFGVKGTEFWSGKKTDVPAGRELFQRYARTAGLGHPTGVDLPYENGGIVPDQAWCHEQYLATKSTPTPTCQFGWLPGYTVNMSIGQGDMRTTPLQMAVTYAAIANGGTVWSPRLAMALERQNPDGTSKTLRTFQPRAMAHLPLDDTELGAIRQGLQEVISNPNGTAYSAFAGYPLSKYPIAGKTGTAQIGTSAFNDAWFISYGPTPDPRYVIAVYIQKAGHGGESAAPVARQIWESIFGIDKNATVKLGQDQSG